jgi:ribosome-associated toxin RatA of RatAB toxin-antitoxin module
MKSIKVLWHRRKVTCCTEKNLWRKDHFIKHILVEKVKVVIYRRWYFIENLKHKINIKWNLQFNQASNLIKKLIKRSLIFHLVLIINCNVKRTHKRSNSNKLDLLWTTTFSYILFELDFHEKIHSFTQSFTETSSD